MSRDYPRLRYLEAFPHSENDQQLVLLRDPMQLTDRLLAVSPQLYAMLSLFDGRRSLEEIRATWSRSGGGATSLQSGDRTGPSAIGRSLFSG